MAFSEYLKGVQKYGPSSTYNLTLLSNVKQKVKDEPNFYGLLRISQRRFNAQNVKQLSKKN